MQVCKQAMKESIHPCNMDTLVTGKFTTLKMKFDQNNEICNFNFTNWSVLMIILK